MFLPRLFRLFLRVAAIAAVVLALLIGGANAWVIHRAQASLVTSLESLPKNDVGLVLGTSPRLRGNWKNPFFEGRMNTAARLYRSGKVRRLLVSGDNGRKDYDEPSAMRKALMARGVPEAAITLDYAGFRTLDSMARAKTVFGIERATVITDDFHQPRALFLAQEFGLEAVGFPSERVPFRWSKKTRVRETLSRVKACVDVYLLRTKPKYYGPKESVEVAQLVDRQTGGPAGNE